MMSKQRELCAQLGVPDNDDLAALLPETHLDLSQEERVGLPTLECKRMDHWKFAFNDQLMWLSLENFNTQY